MNLIKYWPTAAEVNQCIKPEAEAVHDAVLLAVHQPAPLSYRIGAGEKIATTEEELYRYFTSPDVPTGAHVVPITGASGVGKSHLVRLLAARLKSEDSSGQFVVIRIPKSASLRRVVELILDPLPDKEYVTVKQEFKKAMAQVNIDTATINFQAHLEIALRDLANELASQAIANQSTGALLRQQLGHARSLPKFMGDPIIVEHFRKEVFPKIVKRAVAGQQVGDDMAAIEDFTAADFELPSTIELGKAAEPTQRYYQTVLRQNGGAGMRAAAELLNGRVVNQAMGQLFHLNEAMGGMTLQDVILEIRRLLLRDGRELVILVEDFKALTGIQDTLLNVLIQEGVRDGKRELATMRSAIAVTDGYLEGQDTVATRAKRQWIVESHLGSEVEVLDRTKRLVASYLNAARWGHEELLRHYDNRAKNWTGDDVWIEPFVDADTITSDELTAFGGIDGVSLFPFTDLAIECLARMALTKGDVLVFTPRFVIDHVLRNVLLVGREAYGDKQFPPVSLVAPAPSAEVAQWLAALAVSDEQRRRYARLVTVWGNSPAIRAEIGRIPSLVFKAFALESPEIAAPPRAVPTTKNSSGSSEAKFTQSTSTRPTAEASQVVELRATLDNWVQNGVRLDQGVANQIRKALEQAISERIDWNAERCLKLAIGTNRISIPNAAGEGNLLSDVIRVASDHSDPDGRLRTDLAALLRFYQFNKRQTDYDEVDDDLARIANLVSRLIPQALAIVRGQVRIHLQTIGKLLATNSRLLGLLDRGQSPAYLSAFLFAQPQLGDRPPEDAHLAILAWRELQENAQQIRGKLLDMLLERCGSFQGAGRTAYGVDIARIVEYFPKDGDKPDLVVLEPIDAALRSTLANMREAAINVRAKQVLAEALRFQVSLHAELGDSFDKNQVADALHDLADGMQDMGIWQKDELGMTGAAFKRLCDDFRACPLKEALTKLQASSQLDDDKPDGKALSRMAQLDVNPLIVSDRFVTTANKVTAAALRHAAMRQGQTKGLDVGGQADEIRVTFEYILNDMDALEAKGGGDALS
jgi:hypothetical protein